MLGTPQLQNCEPIESRLRRQVQGCWRELLRECKERDPHRQGDIPVADFLGAWAVPGNTGSPPGTRPFPGGGIWVARAG